jgi:hypothetical protein
MYISLGRYSSLADSDHGVYIYISKAKLEGERKEKYRCESALLDCAESRLCEHFVFPRAASVKKFYLHFYS